MTLEIMERICCKNLIRICQDLHVDSQESHVDLVVGWLEHCLFLCVVHQVHTSLSSCTFFLLLTTLFQLDSELSNFKIVEQINLLMFRCLSLKDEFLGVKRKPCASHPTQQQYFPILLPASNCIAGPSPWTKHRTLYTYYSSLWQYASCRPNKYSVPYIVVGHRVSWMNAPNNIRIIHNC